MISLSKDKIDYENIVSSFKIIILKIEISKVEMIVECSGCRSIVRLFNSGPTTI